MGDSFISAQGTSQEHMPANILSDISRKKVATISWAGVSPRDYEELIKKYIKILKNDTKIYVLTLIQPEKKLTTSFFSFLRFSSQ